MKDRLRRMIAWLRMWRVMWTVTHEAEVCRLHGLRQEAVEHLFRELADERKRVDAMLARFSRITWDREVGDVYRLTVTLSPQLIGFHANYGDRHELKILGEHFGRQVEAEVASARFIQSARDRERERGVR